MRCVVDGCATAGAMRGVIYHFFPRETGMREKWFKAINKTNSTVSRNATVCSLHFSKECFDEIDGQLKLSSTAVPTLHLNSTKLQKTDLSRPANTLKTPQIIKKEIPIRNIMCDRPLINPSVPSCCIPNCSSNLQNARLFDVPDDADQKNAWIKALGNDHDQLKLPKGSRICHKHFEDHFLVKGGSYVGQDGIERHYKLRKWRLREDAVPYKARFDNEVTASIETNNPPERVFKVENTCRTCSIQIGNENEGTPLFNGSLSLKKFRPDIFKELEEFGLEVDENDGLPQQICQKCLQSFSILIQFRKQCQRVQSDLLRYFKGKKNLENSRVMDGECVSSENEELQHNSAAAPQASPVIKSQATSVVQNTKINLPITQVIDEDVTMEEVLSETDQIQLEDEGDVENWICEYYIVSDDKTACKDKKKHDVCHQKNNVNASFVVKPDKHENIVVSSLPPQKERLIMDPTEHKATKYNQSLESGKLGQKRCKLCQRLTDYCCNACEGCPRLCMDPCFEALHRATKK